MAVHRNEWLDLCRSLAILLVLLSHGRYFLRPALPWTEHLRFGGFFGVELFFALSGFLIGGILIRLSASGGTYWLNEFYARRWLRTLPNYYLFLLINVLLVWFGVYTANLDSFWKFVIFVQNLFGPHPLFFTEAWSLALEEVFYLLFPVLFLLLSRVSGMPHIRSILAVAIVVILLSLLGRLLVANSIEMWDAGLRKVVFMRFDSLMIGVLLAWLYYRRPGWLKAPGLAVGMLSILLACIIYYMSASDTELNQSFFAKTFYLSLVSFGCAGLLLIGLERRLPFWLANISGFVAKISYSIYLVNIPVMLILIHFFGCCENSLFGAFRMWLFFIILTLIISYGVYMTYERRFNGLRDKLFPATVTVSPEIRVGGHV